MRSVFAVALLACGCAGLVGADEERQDVISLICVCDDVASDFGGAAACEAVLSSRLDGASASTRSKWLDNFVAKKCGDNCARAQECYHTPPTCRSDGQSCGKDSECCAGLVCDLGPGVCASSGG